jgi:hypothetical protein
MRTAAPATRRPRRQPRSLRSRRQRIPEKPWARHSRSTIFARTRRRQWRRRQVRQDDSAIALAEIMLTFGRVQGAAETLAQHIEESSPNNPRPWLMLLDLYRRSGHARRVH